MAKTSIRLSQVYDEGTAAAYDVGSSANNILQLNGSAQIPAVSGALLTDMTKSQVGLANVENTALSTWAGSTNITTLGTITAGTWNSSTAIGVSYGGTGATTASAARTNLGLVIGTDVAAQSSLANYVPLAGGVTVSGDLTFASGYHCKTSELYLRGASGALWRSLFYGGAGDPHLFIDSPSSMDIVLRPGTNEKLRIPASGRLLIGGCDMANGSSIYWKNGAGSAEIVLQSASDDIYLNSLNGKDLIFRANAATEVARVTTGSKFLLSSVLQFSGATSSYPMLKRSSAELHVRLADDSDYASIKAGASKFAANGYNIPFVSEHLGNVGIASGGNSFMQIVTSGGVHQGFTTQGFFVGSDTYIAWNSATDPGNLGTANDVVLYRDAAGILAQRNSTNAQKFRVYNTYTSSTDYERGVFGWATNVLQIGTEAETGTARNVDFVHGGTVIASLLDDSINLASGMVVKVNGNQVLGARGAAVADVAGATTATATASGYGFVDATEMNTFVATVDEIKTQLNSLLSRFRVTGGHGAIAD